MAVQALRLSCLSAQQKAVTVDNTQPDFLPPMGLIFSKEMDKIAPALVKALGSIGTLTKDSENPHYANKYASLAASIAVARPSLLENGIVIMQAPVTFGAEVGCETWLLHESGQWAFCRFMLRPTQQNPQQQGSALSYARRYSVQGLCGMAAEDDDGQAVSGGSEAPAKKAASRIRPAAVEEGEKPYSDEDRRKDVRRLMAALRDYAQYEPDDAAKLQNDDSRHEVLAVQFNGKQSLNDLNRKEMGSLIKTVLNRYNRAKEAAGA